MAKEVRGATINMSGRKGSRKRMKTRRFVQDNELVSKSVGKRGTQEEERRGLNPLQTGDERGGKM